MRTLFILCPVLVLLSACTDFEPRDKVATYNPATHEAELPYPCPDWSSPTVGNYGNYPHSNYGCAVNNNLAVQLADPEDLAHGHPGANVSAGPDSEISEGVIEQYRGVKIPAPLQPIESLGGTSSTGAAQ